MEWIFLLALFFIVIGGAVSGSSDIDSNLATGCLWTVILLLLTPVFLYFFLRSLF
jgi:hypothetical protein